MQQIYNEILDKVSSDISELFNEVILKTPIDTGAARTSHKLRDTPFSANDTRYKTYSNEELQPDLKKDNLQLISNCPYIGKLEQGFSNQAPFGFYNIALLNFNNKHK